MLPRLNVKFILLTSATEKRHQTVFVWCVLLSSYVYLFYLMCICCALYVFVVLCVYLLYYLCIAVLTLDDRLLARSQYPEGPATGHLDTGFS